MNTVKEKIMPNIGGFINCCKINNTVPIYKIISGDLETPITLFTKLYNSENSFLLESAESNGRFSGYSIIGRNPYMIIKVKNNKISIIERNRKEKVIINKNPFNFLEQILKQFECNKYEELPRYFCGITGYFGYDMIQYCEKIKLQNKDDIDLPECNLIIPEEVVVYDHFKQQIYIIVNCFLNDENRNDNSYNELYYKAIKKIDIIEKSIKNPLKQELVDKEEILVKKENIESNISKEDFYKNVEKAKKYIYDGDIFQVVLSQRLKTKLKISDFDVYRKLRLLNPSPYMYFLKYDNYSIVGTSPEMLVRVFDNKIETCPIAGTRQRGKTEEEDIALENELLNDQKELAEHTMLVDLGRNDIGKVSKFGTVKVKNLMHIEKFSHVMHIVTNVEGQKSDKHSNIDILSSVLPAGTVSGAPKIRAMEIIDELETTKRGIYSGAVGYIGFDKNMDTCITIRTAVVKGDEVFVQAGAGIVADSIPEKEYVETLNKAKALITVLEK